MSRRLFMSGDYANHTVLRLNYTGSLVVSNRSSIRCPQQKRDVCEELKNRTDTRVRDPGRN